jgi:hypothetical protein
MNKVCKKMTTTQMLRWVSAIAICVLTGINDAAAQQPNPPGSYQQTCTSIKAEGAKLTAGCASKGSTLDAIAGEKFTAPSSLGNFFECLGDISNNDGNLTCNRNPNSSKMQKTRKAIDEAAMSVLGITPTEQQRYTYISRMFSAGHQATFYKQGGFLTKNVADFLRADLAKFEDMRANVVKRAFMDVYNVAPSNTDTGKWGTAIQNNKFGYAEIVAAEQQKMNSDKVIRRLMINNAYMAAFGRPATAGDFSYWLPRTDIFKDVLAAQRSWLYNPSGAKDLTETVIRAYERKNGKPPKDFGQLGAAIQKAQQSKLIFSEM